MKKLLLTGALLISALSFSQTTIFSEDFEAGSGNWTLNVGGFGANDWIVNNIYMGSFFTTTPAQPGAINPPNGNYLHIYNQATGCALFGDCQAVFLAGSGGDKTAEMTANLSTIGMTNVTFDFWYLCGGMPGMTYGMVEYSIDNGITWTAASPQYANIGAWNNTSLTDPTWDNQAQLKFRFHWYEGTGGNDPSFAVDQVVITAMGGGPGGNTLTTTTVAPMSWCEGSTQTIQVDYTSTGTWNGGNTFTVELSDAAGSFAAPTVIGSVSSTAGSGTIPATVPGATPPGTGYRVRVMGSDPATTGADNGSDIMIHQLPDINAGVDQTICEGTQVTLSGTGGQTYTWDNGVTDGVPFTPGVGSVTYTVIGTDANGCSNTDQVMVTVGANPTVTMTPFAQVCVYDPFFTLTGGSPANGDYTGPGITANVFDPTAAGIGTHTITYTYTDGNGCSGTAQETIVVDACSGIAENTINFELYPNPAQESFVVISDQAISRVEVLDMSGRTINVYEANDSYDVSNVPNGMYLIKVATESGMSVERLMIK
jgi:hypothetical protein